MILSKNGSHAISGFGAVRQAGFMSNENMRAIGQRILGGPEVLEEIELPRPTPGFSEVRVRAAGLNPTDWKHRALPNLNLPAPPFVLGWDVSGVVEAVGVGVTLFQPGDQVFGMLPYPHGHGAFAEYVTGPARAFASKPDNIDHIEAAAVPLAGLTAWQALVDTARLAAGQRVLIHAAAGGVGHLATQIAKARGAYVIGTASSVKHEFLRRIGVDEPIDYRAVDVTEAVREVDVVLDTLGGATAIRSLATLRTGGILVTILPPRSATDLAEQAGRRGVRAAAMLVEYDHAGMIALAELMVAGALRPHIEATLPLAGIAKGHALGDTGRVTGKIVLTVP
jgi:NADPH:quinone reductase-like Zn-dependent oxidoreductase